MGRELLDEFLGPEPAADLLPETQQIRCDPILIRQLGCLITDTIALLETNDACRADHHMLVALRNRLLLAATRTLLNNDAAPLDEEKSTRRFQAYERARHTIEANSSCHSMEELAKEVGVSRRGLEIAFRECTGISPQLFARYVRLNQLHSSLLNASPLEITVSMIEQDLGIFEFGRTAGYYRKLFGELPRETLERELPLGGMRLSDALNH